MNPYSYPTTLFAEWGIVPVIHPTVLSEKRVGQLHPKAAPCGKENGRFQFPVFLSVATRVWKLGYRYSRTLLRED